MKTVKLAKPLRGPKGMVDCFQFREPRFEDYMVLGDPRAPIVNGEKVYYRPIPETVKDYAERLGVGVDPNVMAGASLKDTLAIEEAILDFFRDAESPETAKTTSDSSAGDSPSVATKASQTSDA